MIVGNLWEWDDGQRARQTEKSEVSRPYLAILQILPKLAGDGIELTYLDKKKIKDNSAAGIRATWKGGGGDYYFDEASGLMVEENLKWRPSPGKEFIVQMVFSDHNKL
jgi:hypothetical protein